MVPIGLLLRAGPYPGFGCAADSHRSRNNHRDTCARSAPDRGNFEVALSVGYNIPRFAF